MLKSRIPQIIAELDLVLEDVEASAAEQIMASAKQRLAPHRLSGELEASLHLQEEPEGTHVVAGDDDVFWGHLLEHGTSHSPPYPFLVPALEENRDRIVIQARAALGRL